MNVHDGQVRTLPFYVVMGVTTNGEREILGLWAGDSAEGARFWLQVFSSVEEPTRRTCSSGVCGGLKGLPEAITTPWKRTLVQQCIAPLPF